MAEPSRRPAGVKAPAHWQNPPVPQPAPIVEKPEAGGRAGPEPTRYGDWEHKGIAFDF